MKFIKHKNMRDVCFQVFEQINETSVRGCWINIAMGDPFCIGNGGGLAIETINIKDPENWEVYNDARSAKTGTKTA